MSDNKTKTPNFFITEPEGDETLAITVKLKDVARIFDDAYRAAKHKEGNPNFDNIIYTFGVRGEWHNIIDSGDHFIIHSQRVCRKSLFLKNPIPLFENLRFVIRMNLSFFDFDRCAYGF